MARYTSTKKLTFGTDRDSRAIIVDGSVAVSAYDGSAFVEVDTLTSGSYEYFTKGLRLKFVLTGASYWIDEGTQR